MKFIIQLFGIIAFFLIALSPAAIVIIIAGIMINSLITDFELK